MNKLQKAISICALTAELFGCDLINNPPQNKYVTITARPISVGESFGREYGTVALVLDMSSCLDKNGTSIAPHARNYQLAYGNSHMSCYDGNAEAVALIDFVIKTHDEKIELTGKYGDDKNAAFRIKTLKVQGYTIDFNE